MKPEIAIHFLNRFIFQTNTRSSKLPAGLISHLHRDIAHTGPEFEVGGRVPFLVASGLTALAVDDQRVVLAASLLRSFGDRTR